MNNYLISGLLLTVLTTGILYNFENQSTTDLLSETNESYKSLGKVLYNETETSIDVTYQN